jgi:hypothetical protein
MRLVPDTEDMIILTRSTQVTKCGSVKREEKKLTGESMAVFVRRTQASKKICEAHGR